MSVNQVYGVNDVREAITQATTSDRAIELAGNTAEIAYLTRGDQLGECPAPPSGIQPEGDERRRHR